MGPQTEALVQKILSDHAMRNLGKAQAILRLTERYGEASMKPAAKRALFFGNFHHRSFKTILEKGWLTLEPPPLERRAPLSPLDNTSSDFMITLLMEGGSDLINLHHQLQAQLKTLRLGEFLKSWTFVSSKLRALL